MEYLRLFVEEIKNVSKCKIDLKRTWKISRSFFECLKQKNKWVRQNLTFLIAMIVAMEEYKKMARIGKAMRILSMQLELLRGEKIYKNNICRCFFEYVIIIKYN